jgi:plastocyanin domain-containing protein
MKLVTILVGTIIAIFPMGESEIPHSLTNRSFQPIEQSLPVKVGVVLGGLMLIGAELWWFLGRKQQK